jgi:membrane protease YdiL (CAAX protease family)
VPQLAVFLGLAFAGFWLAMPLAAVAPALPVLIGTWIPALAAVLVAWATGGRAGVRELVGQVRIRRVGWAPFLFALAVPLGASVVAVGLGVVLRVSGATDFGPVGAMSAAYFLFAIGEELGWRGLAQPRLLAVTGPITASLGLGLAWFAWHAPLFLPAMLFADVPIVPTAVLFVAVSIAYTRLYAVARGSILPAVVLHGATNAFGFVVAGASLTDGRWLQAAAYVAVASTLIAADNRAFGRRGAPTPGLP